MKMLCNFLSERGVFGSQLYRVVAQKGIWTIILLSAILFSGCIEDGVIQGTTFGGFISNLTNMTAWTTIYINESHANGTLITEPYGQGVTHPTTSSIMYIAPGGYQGRFRIGTSSIPLIRDPDQSVETGQFGYENDPLSNFSDIEFKGSDQDTSLWLRTRYKNQSAAYNLFNNGHFFSFSNNTNFIVIGQALDFQKKALVGVLDMNSNRIVNSPDISMLWSSGIISGGNLTYNNVSHTYNISEGTLEIRTENNEFAPLCNCYFNAQNFTQNATSTITFIYAEYLNDNVAELKITNNRTNINGRTQTFMYTIFQKHDNEIMYIDERFQNIGSNLKIQNLLYDVYRFQRASGAMLGNPGGGNLSITQGKFYFGLIPITSYTRNTTTGDTYEYYYRNTSTNYISVFGRTTLNNSVYDNNGVITNMLPNQYKNEWIYLEFNMNLTTDSNLAIIMGQSESVSLSTIQAQQPPVILPSSIENMGKIVGRAIMKTGQAEPIQIDTVFAQAFTSSSI